MNPAARSEKLTYEDFLLFPDDGQRHELIDGEHYVTASPNLRHQRILMSLGGMIWSYLQQHPIGEVFNVPLDVVLSDFDVVEPDLQFIARVRQARVLTATHVRGAPDLVVEVASPSTRHRDDTVKRRLYEQHGVAEYWLIEPRDDTITIYRLSVGRYAVAGTLCAENGDVLTTPLLPGLELPLARIFAA